MSSLPLPPSGVLFDLDGTLLDSAPGLYAALQAYAGETGIILPPYDTVREVVSRGASAVLRAAWPSADSAAITARTPRFLELYASVMGSMSTPFDGVEPLLDALETAGVPWGIVTNKAGFLTEPLLKAIGWWSRAASVVAGDTLPQRKPDPEPVLHACQLAGIDPTHGLFVGDDPRDIQAGRTAGMATVAAAWGYLGGSDPATWGADIVLDTPSQLTRLLQLDLPA
ncbi:MAG TPA: phosphoglycolate phosphatase [Rhodanobacteraceae bacterium]